MFYRIIPPHRAVSRSLSQYYVTTHNLEPTTAILYSRMSKPLAGKAHLNFALRFLRQGLSSSHIEHDSTRYKP